MSGALLRTRWACWGGGGSSSRGFPNKRRVRSSGPGLSPSQAGVQMLLGWNFLRKMQICSKEFFSFWGLLL